MAIGDEGMGIRYNLIAALWQDTDVRKKQLGVSYKKWCNSVNVGTRYFTYLH